MVSKQAKKPPACPSTIKGYRPQFGSHVEVWLEGGSRGDFTSALVVHSKSTEENTAFGHDELFRRRPFTGLPPAARFDMGQPSTLYEFAIEVMFLKDQKDVTLNFVVKEPSGATYKTPVCCLLGGGKDERVARTIFLQTRGIEEERQ